MTAILRGNRTAGYRTTTPLTCPCCLQQFDVAGAAAEDRHGPHLLLHGVERRSTDYSDRDLDDICGPLTSEERRRAGFGAPRGLGKVELRDDPVPRFDGTDT